MSTAPLPSPAPGAGGAATAGLHVVERPPSAGWDGYTGPVVIFVHGSLDRAASFARTVRRLPDWGVVTYDRRGYQSNRRAGVAERFSGHVDDLLAVADAYGPGRPVTAVGHSVGGTVVMAAAARRPPRFASIAVYEPSLPWLGLHPPVSAEPLQMAPGAAAEWFFRRLVGNAAWDRMSEDARTDRRADGPALLADLTGIRHGALFDPADVTVPTLLAHGGSASFPHHVETVRRLAALIPRARLATVPEASHGVHLSHPDAFARLVEEAVAMGGDPS